MASETETHEHFTTGNALMDLRLIMLKTIAKVWEDDKKRNAHGKENQDHYSESLRHQLIHKTPTELIQYFRNQFGYIMPFDNFGIKFIKGSAVWNYYGDNEWKKPLFETITLILPSCEKEWLPYEQASCLMEYYSHFPTFFGLSSSQNNQQNERKKETSTISSEIVDEVENTVHVDSPQLARDMSGNDYHMGVSEDPFLSFGAVINKLIAAAWCSKEFRKAVDYDAYIKNKKSEKENLYKDKRQIDRMYFNHIKFILKEHYSFEIPWAFHLKLTFARTYNPEQVNNNPSDPRASFGTKDGGKWKWRKNPIGSDGKKTKIIRNTVSLEIPIAPDCKKTSVSLALARYNAIGPAYPFTCS